MSREKKLKFYFNQCNLKLYETEMKIKKWNVFEKRNFSFLIINNKLYRFGKNEFDVITTNSQFFAPQIALDFDDCRVSTTNIQKDSIGKKRRRRQIQPFARIC